MSISHGFAARGGLMAASMMALLLAGCSSIFPSGQLSTVEAQNRSLAEQTKAQLAELDNLRNHTRQLEDKLIRAEQQLAVLEQTQGAGSRQVAAARRAAVEGGIATGPTPLSGRLADLSQKYPMLQFDPSTGVSKLDTDVLFSSGEAQLKTDAADMLADFAAIMQTPEARDMKVMIVGHADGQRIGRKEIRKNYPDNWHLSTARSLAVANALRAAGMPDDRLGVAGYASQQPISPNSTASDRGRNRRVEIFVVAPDTPIVGWTETMTNLY